MIIKKWLYLLLFSTVVNAQQSPWWITDTATLEIPVVVHLLRDTFTLVPSDIYNWLDSVNARYGQLDTAGLYEWEKSSAEVPRIRFVPARRNKYGNPINTPVTVYAVSPTPFSLDKVSNSGSGGVDPISPEHILNIWIARLDTPFGIVPDRTGIAIDYRELYNLSLPLALLSELAYLPSPISETCEGQDTTTCSFEGDGICDLSPVVSIDSCGQGTVCNDTPPFHNIMLFPDSTCPWFISVQQVKKLKQNLRSRYKNWLSSKRQSQHFDNLILRGVNIKSSSPTDSISVELLIEWNTNAVPPPDTLFLFFNTPNHSIKDTVISTLTDGLNTLLVNYSISDTGLFTVTIGIFSNRSEQDSTDNWVSFPFYMQSQPFNMPWSWKGTVQSPYVLHSWNPDFQQGWVPYSLLPARDSSYTSGWMMPFFDYQCRTCSDWLYTPWSNATSSTLYISITYAYTKYDPYHADSLALWLEVENKGKVKVWQDGGRNLQTTTLDRTQWWEPETPLHWKTICIPVMPQQGTFRVLLEAKSDYGNNLFISSISVSQDSCPSALTFANKPEADSDCIGIYRSQIIIYCPVNIYDLTGKTIYSQSSSVYPQLINLPSGTYLVRQIDKGKVVKIIVP